MPFEDANPLPPGLYYAIVPQKKDFAFPVLSTTRPILMLVGGDMKYRDDLHMIRKTLGEMASHFARMRNIECSAFVVAKESGDTDGSKSKQGIFFSFCSGAPQEGDVEVIKMLLESHNVPKEWMHLTCVS